MNEPNPYSEDELIEQPTIDLLAEMGWETLNCYGEFDRGDSPLGRQTKSEVVLIPRLQAALKRLNPDATPDAIAKAIKELTRSRALMSGVEANREIYVLLKDDVKVTTSNPNGEDENTEVLRGIDWKHPENNDFFAATQFWVTGEMYTKRPDLISIAPEGYLIQIPPDSYDMNQVDLSQIDFEQLSEQFNTEHKRVEAERLRGAINAKLTAMIRLNRSRMDYQQKFEQMIAEYNAGTVGVDNFVEGLFNFANELHQENQRASTEEFTEEELAVFDLLTQHEPPLTVPERNEVKTAVRKLLKTLKQEKLGLDWRKRTQSTAEVRETVSNILDDELPQPYTPELFGQKSEAVYQHIYDSYYGEGKSIYTES